MFLDKGSHEKMSSFERTHNNKVANERDRDTMNSARIISSAATIHSWPLDSSSASHSLSMTGHASSHGHTVDMGHSTTGSPPPHRLYHSLRQSSPSSVIGGTHDPPLSLAVISAAIRPRATLPLLPPRHHETASLHQNQVLLFCLMDFIYFFIYFCQTLFFNFRQQYFNVIDFGEFLFIHFSY
jgi:hypothetical protein